MRNHSLVDLVHENTPHMYSLLYCDFHIKRDDSVSELVLAVYPRALTDVEEALKLLNVGRTLTLVIPKSKICITDIQKETRKVVCL